MGVEKYRSWDFNTNLRKGPEDYPVTGIALPRMVNAVGGSTIHFAGHWFRYRPADFRKGTEHGLEGTIDWPFTYEHLAPFYDINDAEVGIADCAATQATRRGRNVTARRSSLARAGGGWRRPGIWLGWQWWPTDNAILTRARTDDCPAIPAAIALADARAVRLARRMSPIGRRRCKTARTCGPTRASR